MNDHRDHDRPFSADSSRNVPGPVGGQLAVRRQRGLAVGQHLAGHRHHAMLGRQRAEVLPRRGGGEVEVGLHAAILPDRQIAAIATGVA